MVIRRMGRIRAQSGRDAIGDYSRTTSSFRKCVAQEMHGS